jgi:Coenzyme PQQ synthesis protein D (PqqD)
MTSAMRFRLNDKGVVFERFDDEVLAINLETGTYYSLPGVSAQIWNWLIGGADVEAVKQALMAHYNGDTVAIDNAVTQFVSKMQLESLLVPAETIATSAAIDIAPGVEKKPFIDPIIETYTDLQDLLLLDPIHDVDERGWPVHKVQTMPIDKN